MATITVQYDARNISIKKLLEVIVSLGGTVLKNEVPVNDSEIMEKKITINACKDADEGNLKHYKSLNDFKKSMYDL